MSDHLDRIVTPPVPPPTSAPFFHTLLADSWKHRRMLSLVIHAVLGVASTAFVVRANRHLFDGRVGATGTLEAILWCIGVSSVALGWYFNIRYVQDFGKEASWVHFTQSLFTNWAANSAAQDYIIANVLLLPLWTIPDGRRRGIKVPWGFFVMSLFTSFAFSVAAYLAVVERQLRFDRTSSPPERLAV